MSRFAAPITALCALLAGIGVSRPWYYWINKGDEPPAPLRGIDGDFLGKYTLVLCVVAAIAALVCGLIQWRSRRTTRVGAGWALTALVALALTSLATLVDWVGHGLRNWRDEDVGISTDWFGVGVFVTLWAAVAGTIAAARLLAESRRSSGQVPPTPAAATAPWMVAGVGVIVFGTLSFFWWSYVAAGLFDLGLLSVFGILLDGTRPPLPPS